MPSTANIRRLALLTVLLFTASCETSSPVAPELDPPAFSEVSALMLVECPTHETRSTSRVIGVLGGSVELDGTRITLPLGAVLLPTTITLTLPKSPYVEVDVRANGREHFDFVLPATISISYAHCTRADIEKAPLSAWHIDLQTKSLLEFMGGTDDPVNRTVTFQTDHLSGFSIAQ